MLRASFLLAAALLAACSSSTTTDGGTGDLGAHDAGPGADFGPGTDLGSGTDFGSGTDAGPPPTGCPMLPAPTGTVVHVDPSMADSLPSIVHDAATGTTILLADGTYRMTGASESVRRIQFTTPGVTFRGASGDSSAVVLDGEYLTDEMLFVGADDVTVAHLTVEHAVNHPIHVSPLGGADIRGFHAYDVRFTDGGEQFLKVNSDGMGHWADDGLVECSTFTMTDAGRPHVQRTPGGCYTGGVDAHGARGWTVRQNRFEGIYCAGEGLAEHAIHFWNQGRDTIVENNVIVNCARGVGFGLIDSGTVARTYADDPYPGVGYVGHYDGIIRNNVVYADIAYFDTGIELDQARGARVYHNDVLSTDADTGFFSSIDYRFANTQVEIRNNLTRRITVRDGASGTVDHNVEMVDLAMLVSPPTDFHLTAGATSAIDQGVVVAEAGLDLDGEPHTHGPPDIGADER